MNNMNKQDMEFLANIERGCEIIKSCGISILMFLFIILLFWLCRSGL